MDKTVQAKVEFDVGVPVESWIDWLTLSGDVFSRNYIGNWARGVEQDDALGWLVWEDDESHDHDEEPDRDAAVAAWKASDSLPANWYRLDKAMAIKAYIVGVRTWGDNWFETKGDANTYDYVLQMAMLGEERYS